MTRLMRQVAFIISILIACFTFPINTFAQSVDDCMSARLADALKLCKSILDSGSRNVDVYWKLSSALYQDGQQALARKTLDDALTLHPGNSKLLTLKEIISSATTEQALIARSAKLNQSSLDKGALKISCLTKSGEEAISACKRRMELTDEDGDRMRARLSELEIQQPPSTVATVPAIPTTSTAPVSTPATETDVDNAKNPIESVANSTALQQSSQATDTYIELSPGSPMAPDATKLAAEAQLDAYKGLVAEVQTRLNEFGFSAGYPDGVPGNNTRNALVAFYTALDAPVNTSITDLTLKDLNNEKRKFNNAEQLLRQSEQAIDQGNSQLAEQKLTEARFTSKLVKVPARLEQALGPTQVATEPVEPTNVPAMTTMQTQVQIPTPTTGPMLSASQTTASDSQRFTELMGQINILHGQIRQKQADEAQLLDRMRRAF